jgi:hypothetical protein
LNISRLTTTTKVSVAIVASTVVLLLLWLVGASFAIAYFAVACYAILLLMVPGYVIASRIFKDSSCAFRVAASSAVSVPIYSLMILVAIGAGQYRDMVSTVLATLMIGGSVFVLIRKKNLVRDFVKTDLTHLKWTLLVFLFAIALMALPASVHDIPYVPGQSLQETRLPIAPGDQYLPFRFEQILLNGADWKGVNFYGIWTVADRTPMMGLVTAFVTSSIHVIPPLDWVWNVPSGAFSWNVFQIVGCLLDAQIILSAYLILEVLFGTKKGRFTMPFLAVNAFMIWNVFYTSPKSMAAYFMLLAVLLILERKFVRGGVLAALGFLSHSYILFYVGGSLFLIYKKGASRLQTMRNLLIYLIPAGLVVMPWFLWSSLIYGHTSSFITYPFASSGPNSTLGMKQLLEQFMRTPLTLFPWVRIVNAARTLLPWPLAITPVWFSNYGWADLFSWSGSLDHLLMYMYLFTLPGALSLSLTLPAYSAWFQNGFRNRTLLASTTAPFIFAVLFFGYPTAGLSILMAQPMVPILIGAAVERLSKRLAVIVFVGMLIEYVYFIWAHVYPANLILTNVRSPSDLVILGVMVAWIFIVGRMTIKLFGLPAGHLAGKARRI